MVTGGGGLLGLNSSDTQREDESVKARLLVCAVTLLAAGCVELDHGASDKDGWVDRTYRTGSNIPRKSSPQADGVAVVNKDEVDAWRNQTLPPGVGCNQMMGCGGKPGGR